jgi:hypothetical protein
MSIAAACARSGWPARFSTNASTSAACGAVHEPLAVSWSWPSRWVALKSGAAAKTSLPTMSAPGLRADMILAVRGIASFDLSQERSAGTEDAEQVVNPLIEVKVGAATRVQVCRVYETV